MTWSRALVAGNMYLLVFTFSIIAQVIIEMRVLWLVANFVKFRYNHRAQGDYNTEVLIFKMAVARFLDVFENETSKMKENAVFLIITWAIILKQLFSSGSVRGLFDNTHFAFGE